MANKWNFICLILDNLFMRKILFHIISFAVCHTMPLNRKIYWVLLKQRYDSASPPHDPWHALHSENNICSENHGMLFIAIENPRNSQETIFEQSPYMWNSLCAYMWDVSHLKRNFESFVFHFLPGLYCLHHLDWWTDYDHNDDDNLDHIYDDNHGDRKCTFDRPESRQTPVSNFTRVETSSTRGESETLRFF